MRFINAQQVVDMLNVKVKTVYGWVHKDIIPYYKPSCNHLRDKSALRFDLDEIQIWAKTKKNEPNRKVGIL